jgi:hypothetical protein
VRAHGYRIYSILAEIHCTVLCGRTVIGCIASLRNFTPQYCAGARIGYIQRGKTSGQTHGNKLQDVKPIVQAWQSSSRDIRREEVILTRNHTGHSRLTHGYLLHGERVFAVRSPLPVRHSLIECPLYDGLRHPFHIQATLGGDLRDGNSSVNAYLNSTGFTKPIGLYYYCLLPLL